jgi:hypothetical protein
VFSVAWHFTARLRNNYGYYRNFAEMTGTAADDKVYPGLKQA